MMLQHSSHLWRSFTSLQTFIHPKHTHTANTPAVTKPPTARATKQPREQEPHLQILTTEGLKCILGPFFICHHHRPSSAECPVCEHSKLIIISINNSDLISSVSDRHTHKHTPTLPCRCLLSRLSFSLLSA